MSRETCECVEWHSRLVKYSDAISSYLWGDLHGVMSIRNSQSEKDVRNDLLIRRDNGLRYAIAKTVTLPSVRARFALFWISVFFGSNYFSELKFMRGRRRIFISMFRKKSKRRAKQKNEKTRAEKCQIRQRGWGIVQRSKTWQSVDWTPQKNIFFSSRLKTPKLPKSVKWMKIILMFMKNFNLFGFVA